MLQPLIFRVCLDSFGEGFMATISQTEPLTEAAPTLRESARVETAGTRNVSIDAYRGLVMLLMMAEVLRLSRVAAAYPTSLFWKILAFIQKHTEGFGCSLHATIQPGFPFFVGLHFPYSIVTL